MGCVQSQDFTLEMRSSFEKCFPFKKTLWSEGSGSQGKKNKNLVAAEINFHLGNMQIVNWGSVLEEAGSFGQHAKPLCFDGIQTISAAEKP